MDNHLVRIKISTCFAASLLALFALGLVGCDKVTTVIAKFAKPTTTTAPASEEATAALPDAPIVKAVYRRDQVSNITPATYPGFIAKKDALVIVDFYADWCGPCRKLSPVLAVAAEENPGVVYVGKMDVDQAGSFPSTQGVQGIPDVRIFKNGKEVDRFVGFPGESEVLRMIAQHAKGIQPAPTAEPPVDAPAQQDQAAQEVKPFSKGWLPPGMSRAGDAKPVAKPKSEPAAN